MILTFGLKLTITCGDVDLIIFAIRYFNRVLFVFFDRVFGLRLPWRQVLLVLGWDIQILVEKGVNMFYIL